MLCFPQTLSLPLSLSHTHVIAQLLLRVFCNITVSAPSFSFILQLPDSTCCVSVIFVFFTIFVLSSFIGYTLVKSSGFAFRASVIIISELQVMREPDGNTDHCFNSLSTKFSQI